jgi:hypothetical protein
MAVGKVTKRDTSSELAIFARLIKGDGTNISLELARYLLALGFDEADQSRIAELAERNQEGTLSGMEKAELENYVKAGHLLALLHSRARLALKAGKGK